MKGNVPEIRKNGDIHIVRIFAIHYTQLLR